MSDRLRRLGTTCARHPWRILSGWLLAALTLLICATGLGGSFTDDFRIPGADSQQALDLARTVSDEIGATSADIVLHRSDGPITELSRQLSDLTGQIADWPQVGAVSEPPGTDRPSTALLSADAATLVLTVQFDAQAGELAPVVEALDEAAEPLRQAGVQVEFRGQAIDAATQPGTGPAELVGVLVALGVAVLALGTLVAAVLPIVVALVGLLVATALVLLAGAFVDIPAAAPIVAVMLGLGAGIDYALFVVSTYRDRLARPGVEPTDAVGEALAGAGHAVLFAGATVVLAILGLAFAGIPFIAGMGIAAALTVVVMMLAALTLLPAVLGLLGERVNRLPVGRRSSSVRRTGRWGHWVVGHRGPALVGGLAVLLLLAAPVLALRLGTPDDGNSPLSQTQRRAYDLVGAEFGPGWNGPLLVVVQAAAPSLEAKIPALSAAIAADPAVSLVAEPQISQDGGTGLITVIPRQAPQSEQVGDLVHRLRSDLLPDSGLTGHVGGTTAYLIDVADAVAERLPWVVAAVVLAGALTLTLMFRAPLVALKAAALAVLSIAAGYGVLVMVFQWGWGLGLLGIEQPVPIMSIVPMLLFAVLFGLTMDYEVFLLSAIRQQHDGGADPDRAVVEGLSRTARVITAAAVIMAVVFAGFLGVEDTLVQMVGVGLATAVLIDATVLRMLLSPAVMSLLGERAWWPGGGGRTPVRPVRSAPAPIERIR